MSLERTNMEHLITRFHHKEPQRNIAWLLVGISGISSLAWLTNTQNPANPIFLLLFFSILFFTVYSIAFFITYIVRRSLLISGGVFLFFFLRYLGLREPLYIVLLAASLISLELSSQKR
jgi:hypothetical protein